ncbi:TPA-induced transmembrane protein [Orycteropus afer afer]|uniref:TPA-induced transmembrane protein n=1 Tax=Orycteropus afer afer TaxID=1230840 RepID=A0A8B7ADU5_ORYAF|nr:TPA-induced transmembrane protein [Orycteropus afer afer]
MEGAKSPSPGDQLELSVLEEQPDEQTPLNGVIQIIPSSAEEPSLAQATKQNPWSSCNKNLVGKCKLWMVIASIFVGLIIVVIISLCLLGVVMVERASLSWGTPDGDSASVGIWVELALSSTPNHRMRLTDVYSSSPSLSRYFTSIEIADFSGDNATVTYHLQFGVPSEDDGFMKYMMNEELVLGILLQDIHDQNISSCETLGLDPTSFSFFGK